MLSFVEIERACLKLCQQVCNGHAFFFFLSQDLLQSKRSSSSKSNRSKHFLYTLLDEKDANEEKTEVQGKRTIYK